MTLVLWVVNSYMCTGRRRKSSAHSGAPELSDRVEEQWGSILTDCIYSRMLGWRPCWISGGKIMWEPQSVPFQGCLSMSCFITGSFCQCGNNCSLFGTGGQSVTTCSLLHLRPKRKKEKRKNPKPARTVTFIFISVMFQLDFPVSSLRAQLTGT